MGDLTSHIVPAVLDAPVTLALLTLSVHLVSTSRTFPAVPAWLASHCRTLCPRQAGGSEYKESKSFPERQGQKAPLGPAWACTKEAVSVEFTRVNKYFLSTYCMLGSVLGAGMQGTCSRGLPSGSPQATWRGGAGRRHTGRLQLHAKC